MLINFGTSANLCENIVHYYVAYFDLTLELVTKLLKVFTDALVEKGRSIQKYRYGLDPILIQVFLGVGRRVWGL